MEWTNGQSKLEIKVMTNRQTDKTIYILDAHMSSKSSLKILAIYLQQKPKSYFLLLMGIG